MNRPTVDQVKTWSRVDFTDLEEPFSDDDLEVLVIRSCDYIEDVTGREMDSSMPDMYVSIAEQATQMRVEQLAFQAQPDYVETGSDDLIASFNAGSYSETRRDEKGGSPQGVYPPVNSWPALNSLLWMLMTDDMRDYWNEVLGGGQNNRPAFETTEVDWSTLGGVYTEYGGLIGEP